MFHDIRLQAFRSYTNESFEFTPGVNIIVGPNASGKTNLLEALLMIATGSSYRARDIEVIQHDAPWTRLDVSTDTQKRSVKLIPQQNGVVQKEFIIDNKTFKRLSLQYSIPVVLFEPNHLLLLHGSPDLRREYIDELLSQIVPGFDNLRRNYKRALSQRNALLKLGNPSQDQLFVWNLRLSELGGQIALHRQSLVTKIGQTISEIYNSLAHTDDTVEIVYASVCAGEQYGTKLLQLLEKSQTKDLQRGFTGCGPHRDDIEIRLRGHLAQETASRGEIRTLLLALKTKELELLEENRDKHPLLLLDDVFSELDGARRKALTEVIQGYQTFITTTDADVVVQHFMDACNIIPLS